MQINGTLILLYFIEMLPRTVSTLNLPNDINQNVYAIQYNTSNYIRNKDIVSFYGGMFLNDARAVDYDWMHHK